jgi:hypothetical protein
MIITHTLRLSTIVCASTLFLGCAPWNNTQTANYVTVEAETRHDTKLALQNYTIGRRLLDKHIDGTGCDFQKAEKHLRDALAADVRFGPAHHSLGVLYYWQRKLYLAAWEFEYAARLMPDRYEPLNNLGLVYESAGKYEQAKSFFLLAREKSKNHPEVISNLARASFRNGTAVDEMRPILEDVLATDPRPHWRAWSAELLGVNPSHRTTTRHTEAPSDGNFEGIQQPGADQTPVEELPLIAPPMPDAKPPATYFDETLLLP